MESIEYRKATFKDIDHLVQMRIDFLNEIASNDRGLDKELANQLKSYFLDAMPKDEIVNFVAEINEIIVATSSMVIWKMPIGYSEIGKNGRGYILNMYTIPAYRKKGICRVLLDRLKEHAKLLNLERLHLNTTKDGISLYKKTGFEEPYYPELVLKIK